MVSGSVDLESTLRLAVKGKYGRYYTVKAGTNAVAHADGIFKRLGLRTNEPRCDYVLPRDVVYEPDDSWLTIANDLLAMAGFASAYPDAYGVIQMVPYVEPQARTPVRVFNDGLRLHHAPQGIQIGQRGRHPQRRVPDLRDGGGEPLGRVPEHRPQLPRVHPVQGLRGPARRPGDGAHGSHQGGAPRGPQVQGQDEARGQLLVHRVRRVGPRMGAAAAQRRGRHRLSHRRAKLGAVR